MTFRLVMIGSMLALVLGASESTRADGQLTRKILDEQGQYGCLSPDEAELFASLNEHRARHRLRPIGNSRALTMVARIHAIDLVKNRPELGTDARGVPCNLHSWSNAGPWSPVCYTADHRNLTLMLKKPEEITGGKYREAGYENVFWTSAPQASPLQALSTWQESPAHNALILEEGPWEGRCWSALGVGIYGNVAVLWLGSMQDPLGPLPSCDAPGGGAGK